jgi:hypothetical protein
MKIFFSIIVYLLLIASAFSEDLKAELNLISPPAILKEGDIIEGILKVWPLENPDFNEFSKLESLTLGNSLFVSDIVNVEKSENNSDVIEVKLLFIVKRTAENNLQPLTYKEHVVNIQMPSLQVAPSDKDPEDYYVLDQGTMYSNLGKIIIGLISIMVLLVLFFKRKVIQKFISKFKNDPIADAKKKLDQQFSEALKREDYEKIYAQRNVWLSYIKELTPGYNNFFKIMEEHQYKNTWKMEELEEVRNSFGAISRSFK